MRITGGQARGIPLRTPRGEATRPATDRVREAVFSRLGPLLPGATFIDLFAGSGAYGLEAWSRGAAGGCFVEQHRATVRLLQANVEAVARSLGQPASVCRVLGRDVFHLHDFPAAPLVFCDPPWALWEREPARVLRAAETVTCPGGLLVAEVPGGLELPLVGWREEARQARGRQQPSVRFLRRSPPDAG